ncbi:hypothetical protein E2C01_074285 [Portunus trituberculatus]|uniref:Uncharacterized protein n=1 Tax=Portunus trituberculatus TaxID=210409 RepID=A0A5B7I2Z6_PORTR|nr:hypothetical protein [Portunus trituberculatus]
MVAPPQSSPKPQWTLDPPAPRPPTSAAASPPSRCCKQRQSEEPNAAGASPPPETFRQSRRQYRPPDGGGGGASVLFRRRGAWPHFFALFARWQEGGRGLAGARSVPTSAINLDGNRRHFLAVSMTPDTWREKHCRRPTSTPFSQRLVCPCRPPYHRATKPPGAAPPRLDSLGVQGKCPPPRAAAAVQSDLRGDIWRTA